MEKLIELLNESAVLDTIFEDEYQIKFRATKIISKELGFIKWLVDNDKIDVNKVKKEFYNNICITEYGDEDRAMGDDNLVIAVLSISDTPIEDLISYLK